jgi:hypothetical protein
MIEVPMFRLAILGMCVLLQACDAEKKPASSIAKNTAPSYEKVSWTILWDVQGLWGGTNLYLSKDGTAYVQIVEPPTIPYREGGLREQRFKLNLGKEEVDAFIQLLRKHDFLGIQIKDRPGGADEGRPTLLVRFSSGESKAVAKWSNDKHADFDAIYSWLLDFAKNTAPIKPIQEGRYDGKWSPDGFEIPKR